MRCSIPRVGGCERKMSATGGGGRSSSPGDADEVSENTWHNLRAAASVPSDPSGKIALVFSLSLLWSIFRILDTHAI